MDFKHRLKDIVVRGVMINEPVILVEGKPDRQIYQKIAQIIPKKVKIEQIDAFMGYHAGCDDIIKAINDLQSQFLTDDNYNKFLLGIIDRDVRPYKSLKPNEIHWQTLKGLFILKYYSIETYFASENNIIRLIEKCTYATQKDINQPIIDFVLSNLNESLEDLYYISLDALKQECLGIKNYEAVLGYGKDDTGNRVTELASKKTIIDAILPTKKADLDTFAHEKGLTVADIKWIAKGKWYLYNCVYRCLHQIQQIHGKCIKKEFITNYYGDIFKMKAKLGAKQLTEIAYYDMFDFIDEIECTDILLKIKALG